MEPLRPEILQFIAASETLLGYSVIPTQLTSMELDAIAYYLSELAEKFPCQRSD
jgi:hypothetical protein